MMNSGALTIGGVGAYTKISRQAPAREFTDRSGY